MRKRMLFVVGAALSGVTFAEVHIPLAAAQVPNPCTAVFNFIGAAQPFTVPPGVTQIQANVFGAQGGNATGSNTLENKGTGGLGAGVSGALITVAAGDSIQVIVAGQGGPATSDDAFNPGGVGGFGYAAGGGKGGDAQVAHGGGGGGGASAILVNGNPVVVSAGGGGGAHGGFGGNGGAGGTNGTSVGTGAPSAFGLAAGNGGGGGIGSGGGQDGAAGTAGAGGAGGNAVNTASEDGNGDAGGGGGGGFIGGGGGGGGVNNGRGGGAGGGGGSSFSAAGGTISDGVREGDGHIDLAIDQAGCPAELAITKVASPTSAPIGSNVTYTIGVTNNGPNADTGVVVTDTLPPEVTYVSDTCGGVNAPPWTWQIGAMAAGATATCTITVTANAPGNPITNRANVTGDLPDRDPTNNQASAPIAVPDPVYDLAITKTASPTTAAVGDNVTYTLTVQNLGPDPADHVVVADRLAAEVSFVSDTCGGVLLPSNASLWSWFVGPMAPGATATCAVTVNVVTFGDAITNTAVVGVHDGGEPNLTNNQADAAIGVPAPELPPTGASLAVPLLLLGGGLVGLGGLFVLTTRRLRRL